MIRRRTPAETRAILLAIEAETRDRLIRERSATQAEIDDYYERALARIRTLAGLRNGEQTE